MSQTVSEFTQFTVTAGRSSLIMVPTYVNGRGPYNFILDTGAAHTLISPGLASSLGVQSESEEKAFGAGGAVQISLARVDSIAVGSARQENAQVAITNELEQIGAALRAQVDGDLGFSFMKDFRVTVDYQRNVLRLARASDNHDENSHDATTVPFTLASADPLIVVQAVVNEQGPFQFALDTGAGRTVLTPELAERLNIGATKEVKGAGVGGEVQLTRATVDSLSLSGATVRNNDVVLGAFLHAISGAAGTELEGVVGNNFLNQFLLTIDYAQNRLTLAVPRQL
jgi:predicted aspartyl protease